MTSLWSTTSVLFCLSSLLGFFYPMTVLLLVELFMLESDTTYRHVLKPFHDSRIFQPLHHRYLSCSKCQWNFHFLCRMCLRSHCPSIPPSLGYTNFGSFEEVASFLSIFYQVTSSRQAYNDPYRIAMVSRSYVDSKQSAQNSLVQFYRENCYISDCKLDYIYIYLRLEKSIYV